MRVFFIYLLIIVSQFVAHIAHAQAHADNFECNSLYQKNKDIFIEAFYFSTAIGSDLSKKSIDNFFKNDLDLVMLDSLLNLKSFNANKACQTLKISQYKILSRLYIKDEELDKYLRDKQIDYENLMRCLYKKKEYRQLISKHFRNSKQSIYSLSVTQMRVVVYNLVCYMTLNNIKATALHLK